VIVATAQSGFGSCVQEVAPVASRISPSQAGRRRFLIADAVLEVVSHYPPLLEEFEARYGDCAVAQIPEELAVIRCTGIRVEGSSFLSLHFEGRSLPEPFETALTPYRMLRHLQSNLVNDRPQLGWRAIVKAGAGEAILLAGDRERLLINLDEAPPELLTDCVIGVVQGAQTSVSFLHAASFGIGDRGALLIGKSYGGKSTTVLALAQRGHSFLGDDMAAVRLPDRQLIPFPKSAGLRDGPLARAIEAQARTFRQVPATGLDGVRRKLVRVGDMFPSSGSGVLPLQFAFVLDGFATKASVKRYCPDLRDVDRLKSTVSENAPGWGVSPGRDLMKFLKVVDILSQAQCYLLRLGPPEDSVALIEQAMEATCS
jgi:hypothetical protein